MDHILGYRCVRCGVERPEVGPGWCVDCGPLGTQTVLYDFELVASRISKASLAADPDPSPFRYRALLPLPADAPRLPLEPWRTPVIMAPRLGFPGELAIKDDGRLPSSSFKDRATFVAISRALASGSRGIVCASTGNAASSLAAFAAAAGIPATILVPAAAPRPKLAQVLIAGARVIPVDGSYDDAFDLSLELAAALGLELRSTGVNPYLAEGKKTAALEIAEQYDWEPPDVIAVSAGDGCIIAGLAKGFLDLKALGWIEKLPRLIGVQAEGSAALTRAFKAGLKEPESVQASTLADSISVNLPRAGIQALAGVRACAGEFITVSDEEILGAMRSLAAATGIFAEPAGATAVAGLLSLGARGGLTGQRCLAINTGSMLKDTASALRALGELPAPVPKNLDAVLERLSADQSRA